jgi:hypothetical protein
MRRACARSMMLDRFCSIAERATPRRPSLAPSSSARIAVSAVSAGSRRRIPSAVVSPLTPWLLTVQPGCVALSRF